MLTDVKPFDGLTVHLLSQIDGQVTPAPIDQQAPAQAILAQASAVAKLFADYVSTATESLDVCIYDFRMELASVGDTIVAAINDAAQRGVKVRIAYDASETADEAIVKQFQAAGGDPAPTGTRSFLRAAQLHPAVALKQIAELTTLPASVETIAPGSQIMHNKYMVVDAGTAAAGVWTGSTNFTVDAWSLQENNIVVFSSCPDLAARYTQDFDDLWTSEKLAGTGKGDNGSVCVGGVGVRYAFAPGEGNAIEDLLSGVIGAATQRVRIASMVISSPSIMTALKNQIDAGRDLAGVYDGPQTEAILKTWQARPADAAKAELLSAVIARLVGKPSHPFLADHPDWAHDFMHNKLVVADATIVTGSFNFSTNASRNAENVVSLTHAGLADACATYIDGLVARYATSAGT